MARLTTKLNHEDMLKLSRRAGRAGMTPAQAFRVIATKGVEFFLALMVGATKAAK